MDSQRLRHRLASSLLSIVLMVCMVVSSASACFVCIIPYQSLLDKIESSEQAIIVRAVDQQQTTWQVELVIHGKGIQVGQIVSATSELFATGDSQLLRRTARVDPWIIERPVDKELIGFLSVAAQLSAKLSEQPSIREQSQYLRYFLLYLEHPHPQIADAAYNKIARAPYKVLRKIGTEINPDQLLAWLENSQIAPKRGSLYITLLGVCGGEREAAMIKRWIDEGWERQDTDNLGTLLAAQAELNGEETIRFIEKSYIQNRERKLGELIAAINSLRVHGQADGNVSRARIMASFHLLLRERPALVEMIIEDCARWKEWTIAPKLMDIYASGKQPWNNAMILKYLEACPLSQAKHFVKHITAEHITAETVDYDSTEKGNDIVVTTGTDEIDYSHTIKAPVEIWQAQNDSGEIGSLE